MNTKITYQPTEITTSTGEKILVGHTSCFESQGLTMDTFAQKTTKAILDVIHYGTATMFPKTEPKQQAVYDTSVVAIREGDESIENRIIGAYSYIEKTPEMLGIHKIDNEKYIYLTGLYLDAMPKYRGQGIGDTLVQVLTTIIEQRYQEKNYVTFVETVTPNTAAAHLHASQGFTVIDYPNQKDLESTITAMKTIGRTRENLLLALVCMARTSPTMTPEHAQSIFAVLTDGYKTGSDRYNKIVDTTTYLRKEKKAGTPFTGLDKQYIQQYKNHAGYFAIPQFKGAFYIYDELRPDPTLLSYPPTHSHN